MSLYASKGGADISISDAELRQLVKETVEKSGKTGGRMLLLPPDHTRLNSRAGRITEILWEEYADSWQMDIMPALGTHVPMGNKELELMFGKKIPKSMFKAHDWRNDVVKKGVVPSEFIKELSKGKVDYEVAIEVNRILFDGYDLILSIGQVVPHEVVGMANYTKNIMVGVGGSDIINKSHFLGAVSGMESMMGRADSPVRRLFNYGVEKFLSDVPLVYMMTVMERNNDTGEMIMRGFYSSADDSAFQAAAALSVETNLVLLDEPLDKVIVFLDPEEFNTTWLGNKSIYRTRMAIADNGTLIVLAPGLHGFGEDPENDRLIAKYGYRGTPHTLKCVEENEDLRNNLSAAAHLIHGSNEGRFRTIYAPGPEMSKEAIEAAGFEYADYDEVCEKYQVEKLKDGFNIVNGEKIFYISNPALGLWALKKNFMPQE